MPEIVPFADSHWDKYIAWRNVDIPGEPVTVAYAREMDQMVEREFYQERHALVDGDELLVAGLIVNEPGETGNPYYMRITAPIGADPAHLMTMGEHLKERGIARETDHLMTWFRESRTDIAEAVEALGMEYRMRAPESSLLLADLHDEPKEIAGIRIEPFDFAATDMATRREFYDAFSEMERDIPNTFVNVLPSYEFMEEEWLGGRGRRTIRWVAWDADQMVGITELVRNELIPTQSITGLTGVRRDWRRRGIAMALKVISLRAFRDLGGEKVYTTNEENNPMFQINLALGFREEYALAAYVWEPK